MGWQWGAMPLLRRGELGPHLTPCRRKLRVCPFLRGELENVVWAGAYLHTKWHRDPSSRLATIHRTKTAGLLCPVLWRDMAGAEAYLRAKFHLDPSNRLATIHQCHRQTGQRSDSIGRTVLQTVAQKFCQAACLAVTT